MTKLTMLLKAASLGGIPLPHHQNLLLRFSISSSKLLHRRLCTKMTTSTTTSLTQTIHLNDKGGETGRNSVEIIAAPGLSNHDFRMAIESSLFKKWLENMQCETGILTYGDMSLKRVLVQGVDMFGTRVGFMKFKADVIHDETGNEVPGIVFSRGPAVAVLILLDSGDKTYVVLTDQVRVPVGRLILELPAGMLDDDNGDVIGTAVREVEEETGIKLKKSDMVNLTAFLEPTTGGKVFPSPGGCDEELSLFMYKGQVDKEVITTLHGKETGLQDHGELIKVRVVPYDKLWRTTADMKVLSAVALYEMAKRDGLLPLK
ncbi:hypothetical protein MKX01_011799 [Papaver californicum]|nr:hypothetical protein MKX01_011799 [Papaver californicum]